MIVFELGGYVFYLVFFCFVVVSSSSGFRSFWEYRFRWSFWLRVFARFIVGLRGISCFLVFFGISLFLELLIRFLNLRFVF